MKKTIQPATDDSQAYGDAGFASSALGRQLSRQLQGGSASQQRIAEFLLRNPVRAAAWGIEELAAHTGTSTATVSRFAVGLGLSGYAALRAGIAEALQRAYAPVFQPVAKLHGAVRRGSHQAAQANPVLVECLEAAQTNLRTAMAGLDMRRLGELAKRLVGARTVYSMGFGLSAHLAAMMALHLQPFCPQLINVVEYGGTEVAAGRLMNIGEGDVLIAIAFPRYAKDAPLLARYARERGAHVVALTDSPASPLAALAHEVLLAQATHPVLSSSSSAALMVIEALASTLMVGQDKTVAQAMQLTEAISGFLYAGEQVLVGQRKTARRPG